MKNRIIAISDIHGCRLELGELLDKVKYNPSLDQLILLGDYVDRGMESKQVVSYIMKLAEKYGAIALRGNHDQMFVDYLDNKNEGLFLQNGGYSTLCSYIPDLDERNSSNAQRIIKTLYHDHVEFLRNLPYYHETERHIFVHGGVNPAYADWKNTPPEEMMWIRDPFHKGKNQTGKTVVFGHTPVVNLHSSEGIWDCDNKIGIDGACAYGKRLNCLVISDNETMYEVFSVDSRKRRSKSSASTHGSMIQ